MYHKDGNEDNSEEEEEYFKQKSTVNREDKLWDSFQDPPCPKKAGSSAEETERFNSFVRIIKFIVCFILFILILGSSVVSKMSLLFMTSHIPEGRAIPFCNINLPQRTFVAVIPTKQRIAWIWAIIFAFAVPEVGTFLRAARMCFFRSMKRPKLIEFCFVLCAETFHVVGMAILMIMVLPNLDVIQGVMLTNCLCFVPAVLSLFADWHDYTNGSLTTKLKIAINILTICAQVTGFVVWPLLHENNEMWVIPAAVICISFHWWENFVSSKSRFTFIVLLDDVKKSLAQTRYFTYLYISIWKLVLFSISAMLLSKIEFTQFFTDFLGGFGNHTINITQVDTLFDDYERFPELKNMSHNLFDATQYSTPGVIGWTIFIQVACSYACYVFTKFTSKIQIQSFSFGVPINLTVPVSISILLVLCGLRATNECAFHDLLPDYLFFTPPPVNELDEYIVNDFAWIWILWLMSQTWITRHIWTPKSDKNASTDSLFITPQYNGLLIDQSLPLNRRREDLSDVIKKKDLHLKKESVYNDDPYDEKYTAQQEYNAKNAEDKVPQIFICATMWHENKEEMMEFLKSIIRLDEDQSARRLARNYIQDEADDIDPDYYDLETHIFFDDAFITDKTKKENAEANPLNEYVKMLITSISDAARDVHKTDMKIRDPQKFVTPYGGRLVWTLPGKTKMIAHLKHTDKIRKKKRWSQVMYMYYLLGYRIMQLDIPDERKLVISKNTFLLALDGDIDFQPNAVQLLISRMKVDDNLGAACGRIHPIGAGPMVWYQKFEYAIGHWLQKATEHVIGCVLCSPGCFSLFRARALMENSVMKKYTTNSEDARHFVQYDQGEDRWLCTLLLKQRFRVEYSAASDAYTHSPEGFNEFYNQRRRWVPSTMANILDLLGDAKEIVKTNDSISMPYIVYQSMLMVGTILGPGTIFLMMIGAIVAVFGIDIWTAFLWNFLPLLGFMISCYWFKQKYQLTIAFFLTAIYSLVMMAVLIGIIIQLLEDGVLAPTSVFFFAIVAQICIAGILHPQEIWCLFHGIIYYITIPSMYMLLVIYSLFNMNDVSWGTRETPKAAEPVKTETKGPGGKYITHGKPEENGTIDVSLFNIFRCMLCTHSKPSEVQQQLVQVTAKLNEIRSQIYELEKKAYNNTPRKSEMGPQFSNTNYVETASTSSTYSVPINIDEEEPEEQSVNTLPDWLYDPDIRNGEVHTISLSEQKFWLEMIEKYLKPLDLSKQQLAENKEKLKVLRDSSVFAFVMLNALFVLVVFLLQLNSDELHLKWPWGGSNEIFYDQIRNEILVRRTYLELEPIGLLFVIFFGIILLIQFIAMLIHRFGTMSQILAAIDLDCYCGEKAEDISAEADMRGKAVKIVRKLQKPKPQWDENELDEEQKHAVQRRDTIKKITLQQKKKKQDYSDLERNFKNAFFNDKTLQLDHLNLARKTIDLLEKRRSTIKARHSMSHPTSTTFYPNTFVVNNPRPSLINPGNHSSHPTSYINRSFEPDLFEKTELDENSVGDNDINSGPRYRPSNRPNQSVKFA